MDDDRHLAPGHGARLQGAAGRSGQRALHAGRHRADQLDVDRVRRELRVVIHRERRPGEGHPGHAQGGEPVPEELGHPRRPGHLGAHAQAPHLGHGLHHHFLLRHPALLLDQAEAGLDPLQAPLLLGHPLRRLGLLQPQHAAQLPNAQALAQDRADLLQGQPQFLEGHDPVDQMQLRRGVVAVARGGIDGRRLQQAEVGVVAQCRHRQHAEPGEVADLEQARLRSPAPRLRRRRSVWTLEPLESQAHCCLPRGHGEHDRRPEGAAPPPPRRRGPAPRLHRCHDGRRPL